jgi:hypothetical protein
MSELDAFAQRVKREAHCCGPGMPCVLPTPASRAQGFAQQLRVIYQALEAFERELKDHPGPTIREQFRPYHVAVAMDHLRAAMDALAFVSGEERSDRARGQKATRVRRSD